MRPLEWHTYIVNCTENAGGVYLYFAGEFLNTKLPIQCKRIQNLQYFFFLLICILMGKGLNKLGEFNFIYKSFNVFRASILTI